MTVRATRKVAARAAAESKPVTGGGTLIVRATLPGRTKVSRDIELDGGASLHDLAEAIVASFDFDFDHAFGFYSGKTQQTLMRAHPKYELFVDLGQGEDGALSVERTTVATAFPTVGHAMTFYFDYGDGWMFAVELRATGEKVRGMHYPRIVATHGKAPPQYPDFDDDGE
jgi:hypothetical protein